MTTTTEPTTPNPAPVFDEDPLCAALRLFAEHFKAMVDCYARTSPAACIGRALDELRAEREG